MSQGQRLRTCIATRQKHPDTELLRVVADRDDLQGAVLFRIQAAAFPVGERGLDRIWKQ